MTSRLDVTSPEVQQALDDLRSALAELHMETGQMSVRAIAARTSYDISHSTVANVLNCATPPKWRTLSTVISAMGGEPVRFRQLWSSTHVLPGKACARPVDSAERREFRVMSDSVSGEYTVAELTEESGLVPRLNGLQRWQALAIVSVLDPPFQD